MMKLGLTGRQLLQPVRATAPRCTRRLRVCAQSQETEEVVDANVNAYCSLDESGRRPMKELSLAEKEQVFLDSMIAYYYEQKPILSDEEFDNLKEELTWEGSKVVVLSPDEQRFLEARIAYYAGKPFMSDAEYDALKGRLVDDSSRFAMAQEGPTCTLGKPGERGQKSGAAEADYAKMAALNVPAVLTVLAVGGGVALIPGFDATALFRIPEPYGLLVWAGLVLPAVYVLANAIANFLFKDALILKAPCPNCGEINTTYFGDILTVAGNRDKNVVSCPCCQSELTFYAGRREVVVTKDATA